MTVYLANAEFEVRAAQQLLEAHLATCSDGRCLTCGQPEPCQYRRVSHSTFARHGRLPRRRPNQLRGPVGAAGFDWLDLDPSSATSIGHH